jgi:hypothetical protein
VIAAVAVTLALAAPSREVLIEHWLHANHTHTKARLDSGPRASKEAQGDKGTTLRAVAQRELSIPGRYQLLASPTPAQQEPWWLRTWHWIAGLWQKFWQAFFRRVHVGREAVASIGDVLLVAVVLLLIFVVVRLLMNLQLTRSALRSSSEPLAERPAPGALYNQACNAANRGEYGNAALLLFAATIALLDRHGAVDATSSATVGDLRRELRAYNAVMIESFDAVATPFAQKAYADRAVDEPQWHRAHDAYVTLRQAQGDIA